MRLDVIRFRENDKQTLGKFIVFDDYEVEVANGYLLELPDKDNQFQVSRINEGVYDCVKRHSSKYGDHFHVLDVEDRDYILIHIGNYYTNTRGCLLPGIGLSDINGDGLMDVTRSGHAMRLLNRLLPEVFKLTITDQMDGYQD